MFLVFLVYFEFLVVHHKFKFSVSFNLLTLLISKKNLIFVKRLFSCANIFTFFNFYFNIGPFNTLKFTETYRLILMYVLCSSIPTKPKKHYFNRIDLVNVLNVGQVEQFNKLIKFLSSSRDVYV